METLEEGIFIAVEGLDGSGQSTQTAELARFFREREVPVHETKEPTNNLIGGLIRGQLSHEWSSGPECLQLLFAADRSHHLEKEVLPALENGYVVVSDRYLFSSLAFGSLDLDLEWLETINKHFRLPDASFYIDVSPRVCIERMEESRFGMELFERERSLEEVSSRYERLLERYENFLAIDGERTVEEVHASIVEKLKGSLSRDEKSHAQLLDRIS